MKVVPTGRRGLVNSLSCVYTNGYDARKLSRDYCWTSWNGAASVVTS